MESQRGFCRYVKYILAQHTENKFMYKKTGEKSSITKEEFKKICDNIVMHYPHSNDEKVLEELMSEKNIIIEKLKLSSSKAIVEKRKKCYDTKMQRLCNNTQESLKEKKTAFDDLFEILNNINLIITNVQQSQKNKEGSVIYNTSIVDIQKVMEYMKMENIEEIVQLFLREKEPSKNIFEKLQDKFGKIVIFNKNGEIDLKTFPSNEQDMSLEDKKSTVKNKKIDYKQLCFACMLLATFTRDEELKEEYCSAW